MGRTPTSEIRRQRKRADLNKVIAFCYETIERARAKLAKLENEDGKPTPKD